MPEAKLAAAYRIVGLGELASGAQPAERLARDRRSCKRRSSEGSATSHQRRDQLSVLPEPAGHLLQSRLPGANCDWPGRQSCKKTSHEPQYDKEAGNRLCRDDAPCMILVPAGAGSCQGRTACTPQSRSDSWTCLHHKCSDHWDKNSSWSNKRRSNRADLAGTRCMMPCRAPIGIWQVQTMTPNVACQSGSGNWDHLTHRPGSHSEHPISEVPEGLKSPLRPTWPSGHSARRNQQTQVSLES